MAKKVNVRRLLDLSTAHLPIDLGSDVLSPRWGSTVLFHDGRAEWPGFLLWVPDDPKESADAMEEPVPPEVLAVQLHARKHGCDYVLFDADGPIDDELPTWEW